MLQRSSRAWAFSLLFGTSLIWAVSCGSDGDGNGNDASAGKAAAGGDDAGPSNQGGEGLNLAGLPATSNGGQHAGTDCPIYRSFCDGVCDQR